MSAESYTLGQCIADVKATLEARGVTAEGLEELGRHIRLLTARDDLLGEVERAMVHGQVAFRKLYTEPGGLTLTLGKFPSEEATPIHSHGTWGVLCTYRGRDRYEGWRRLDDGSTPGFAQVEIAWERVLGPGEFVYWFDPPRDIHRQQGVGEAAWELVLMGRDAAQLPRLYFDPERNTVREEPATR